MKKLSLIAILVLGFSFGNAMAQFEGTIEFTGYEVTNGEKQQQDDAFTLFITPESMLLQGKEGYKVGGKIQTEGILIRHNEKDFVILTGENRAMRITKDGITSMMNMFGGDAQNDVQKEMEEASSNLNIEATGESMSIDGYTAEKFIITDKEETGKQGVAWMTKGLDINWGILAEPWGNSMGGVDINNFPRELIFDDGYFPVKWEQYEDGALTSSWEAKITKTNLARSKVQIPSDVKVMNWQQFLFESAQNQ